MNKSRFWGVMCACFFSSCFSSANASLTYVTDGSGELLGIQGIDVGGTIYDAYFTDGSYDSIWGSPDALAFPLQADAETAVEALKLAFDANPLFDDNPEKTIGCSRIELCNMITLYGPGPKFKSVQFINQVPPNTDDLLIGGFLGAATDTTTIIDNVYVEWSVSSVPIPAAVWLFGSGLLGLIGVSRRKKPA